MVLTGDLGAAHAGLDVQRLVMVFSPQLNIAERITAARRMLARAGQWQPAHGGVRCLCGLPIDLTLPITDFPAPLRDRTAAVMEWLRGARRAAARRELALADTGGFPAIRGELPSPTAPRRRRADYRTRTR
jgi:hypothetical protein